jgi:hypothetical protein
VSVSRISTPEPDTRAGRYHAASIRSGYRDEHAGADSAAVQEGLKDILLNHTRLWETLRDQISTSCLDRQPAYKLARRHPPRALSGIL